jgi:hypothetical protein
VDGGPISPGAGQRLWDVLLGGGLVALLALAREIVKLVLNRNRPAADVAHVTAQAAEVKARAVSIETDSTLKIVHEVYGLNMREIERLTKRNAELEAERERNADVVRLAREIVRSDAERKQSGDGPREG